MSEEFDAYYKWLGIPPKDQPPNHYRLLGIELFEENPEVIEASAERQATYLHEVSAGPNVKESQLLLNEIAAARLCLLDPEKKAAYDAKLKSKVTAKVSVEALSGASPLDDPSWDNFEDLTTGDPASATIAAERQTQSSRIPVLWLAIGGGVALLVLITVITIVVLSSGSDDSNVATNPDRPHTTVEPLPDKPKGLKEELGEKPNQRNLGTSESEKEEEPDKPQVTKNPNGGDEPNREDPDIDKQPQREPAKGTDTSTVQTLEQPDKLKDGDTVDRDGSEEKLVIAKEPIRTNGFEPIQPTEVTSLSGGTEFRFVENNCVFAEGGGDDDTYTIEAKTDVPNITAIRLEALPHDLLPASGPGLDEDGGFSIYELRVLAVPASNPDAANEVSESAKEKSELDKQRERLWWPGNPTAKCEVPVSGVKSEEAPEFIDRLIDGEQLYWQVRPGKSTKLTLFMKTPIRHHGSTLLYVQLAQRNKLGHFRVSVSNDPDLAGRKTRIEAALPLFVNLGGMTKKDAAGRNWLASQDFDGGEFGHVGGSPEGNDQNVPFSSCISGLKEFRVTLPDGKYNVTLLFSGRCPKDVGKRSFFVSGHGVDKQPVKDIPKYQNRVNGAVDFGLKNAEAKDGGLTIHFASEKGEPVLNGIVIEKAP